MPSLGALGHCGDTGEAHKQHFSPFRLFLRSASAAIVICCRILGSVAARASRSAIYSARAQDGAQEMERN